jgi:hypothetical protein
MCILNAATLRTPAKSRSAPSRERCAVGSSSTSKPALSAVRTSSSARRIATSARSIEGAGALPRLRREIHGPSAGQGAIEHYLHPERVAWQSMCATDEGVLKGERWCKRCIWGNLLPQWKDAFGNVAAAHCDDH